MREPSAFRATVAISSNMGAALLPRRRQEARPLFRWSPQARLPLGEPSGSLHRRRPRSHWSAGTTQRVRIRRRVCLTTFEADEREVKAWNGSIPNIAATLPWSQGHLHYTVHPRGGGGCTPGIWRTPPAPPPPSFLDGPDLTFYTPLSRPTPLHNHAVFLPAPGALRPSLRASAGTAVAGHSCLFQRTSLPRLPVRR